MRIVLALMFLIFGSSFWTQNLVVDEKFERLGEFYHTSSLYFQWHEGVFSKGEILPATIKEHAVAAFRFSVNSVQVDPNFIIAKLTEELIAGELYQIEVSILKDRLSPFSIREMQIYFGSSFNPNTSFLHGAFEKQLLGVDLSEVKINEFVTLTIDYEAQGGEEFIYLGSLKQKLSISESAKLGLLKADRTYEELLYNSTYYLHEISVIQKNQKGNKVENSIASNWYNYKSNFENYIINGGAESELNKRFFINEVVRNTGGSLIAPYAYSLTQHCVDVDQLDSNDHRYSHEISQLCYMGDGQFILDALKTNVYHNYGEVIWKQEGEEYDTYHVYEKAPYKQLPYYANGEYLVVTLKETLTKNEVYRWSSMLKISEEGTYGVRHLGIHFLESFPENILDSLWQRAPEEVINIEHLVTSEAWSELNIDYEARGGERFIAIGHLPDLNGVIENQVFQKQVASICEPGEYYCYDRYIYYKDSLFARYQLDNMVLVPEEEPKNLSIVYPVGQRVQLEVIFTEIKKTTESIVKMELAKAAVINAQQVLRVEDAICIVDQRKKDPIIFEPNPIINKKKIIRKIAKPKTIKKPKSNELRPEVILFGEGKDEINLNHLVLIVDENLDPSLVENKLLVFTKNGGELTLFYVGEDQKFDLFKSQFETYLNTNIYNCKSLKSDQLVKLILGVN